MKIVCCGDGGMIYCRDEENAKKLRKLAYLGMTTESGLASANSAWWEFDTDGVSGRHVMNDITAAIGLAQLNKLPGILRQRREVWTWYDKQLADLAWLTLPPRTAPGTSSSYYLYWIQVRAQAEGLASGNLCGKSLRDTLASFLKAKGIYTTFRYWPLQLTKGYGRQWRLDKSLWASEHTLCLPLHQGLGLGDMMRITEAICEFDPDYRE